LSALYGEQQCVITVQTHVLLHMKHFRRRLTTHFTYHLHSSRPLWQGDEYM